MQRMNIKCCHCGDYTHSSQRRTLKLFLKLISQEPIWIFWAISPRHWRNAVAWVCVISYAGFRVSEVTKIVEYQEER